METLKHNVIATAEEIMNEEGKKAEIRYCETCGKKMIVNVKESHLRVNSMLGHIDFNRKLVHCRHCGKGYAPFDRELDINKEHKVTKNLTETVCDLAQRMSSFEEASDMLDRYLHIKISHSMIQEISEK